MRNTWLRVLSVVAIVSALVLGGVVSPRAAAVQPTFADVSPGTQFFDEIEWLADRGISTGWTEANGTRTFRPLSPVNRDAMAAFLYRLGGSPAVPDLPPTSPFIDVSPENQFYKEIVWLFREGISTGWPEPGDRRSFRPLQPVARDAMAAFLYRYAGSPAYTAPEWQWFDDVPLGTMYFNEINWLAEQRITTGWFDGTTLTFRPLLPVARDAMAAFMFRFRLVDLMIHDAPQRGMLSTSVLFQHASRHSTDFGPLSVCGPQLISYYETADARLADRMVEHGGAYGDEGEEHYYAEAVLEFPNVVTAEQYVSEVAAAGQACTRSPGYEAISRQEPALGDQAIATLGGWPGDMPWGNESVVARKGRFVVHVISTGAYDPIPYEVSQDGWNTTDTLLGQLP